VPYLTRNDAIFALGKMKSFHDDLKGVMKKNGFNLLSNIGRRNILLSEAQERYFSEALSRKYEVICDGSTGEPDILISSLNRELECKLTSRHKSGAISFQSDHDTLVKKGPLDYLYVVADFQFEKFAVIHYTDLTIDDFRPLSSGSRGKTQMMKYKSSDRARVLVGAMKNVNKESLFKLSKKMRNARSEKQREKIKKSIIYWNNTPTRYRVEMEAVNA